MAQRPYSEELQTRERAIVTSAAWVLRSHLAGLARTASVARRNAEELTSYLAAANTPERLRELVWTDNRAEYEAHLDETDRLFFNYLEAANALKQHLGNTIASAFQLDRAAQLELARRPDDVFNKTPIGGFMNELRRISTHVRLPVTRGQDSFVRDRPNPWSTSVILEKRILRRDGRWKGSGHQYLERAPDPIHVEDLVIEHSAAVLPLAEQVIQLLRDTHAQDFAELERRTVELQRAKLDYLQAKATAERAKRIPARTADEEQRQETTMPEGKPDLSET